MHVFSKIEQYVRYVYLQDCVGGAVQGVKRLKRQDLTDLVSDVLLI